MSFPRYQKYKDSGVEWLGEVPEHWSVTPLKSFTSFSGGGTPSREKPQYWNGTIPWVSPKDMKQERLVGAEECISEEGLAASAASLVPAGRLLMVVRSGILQHTIPVAINEVTVAVNQDMKVFDFDKTRCISAFFLRWVQGLNDSLLLVWAKQGATVESIERSFLANSLIPLPRVEEQRSIVDFLDQETAKIDTLIEEQRRLIALLKEKRQAVISHAVTKGLNPAAPMKDSGDDWLGRIPKHWATGQLARIASRIVVGIAEAATHAYADEGVPILRSTNIRAGRIIGDILRITPEFADERGSKLIRKGDLVTVRTGNAGVTAVVPEELDGCQCFTMLITTLVSNMIPEFFCQYLNSQAATSYFLVEGWGTAQVNISVPILKALPVPIPPPEEQRRIVAYLDGEIGGLDELVRTAEEAIVLLQERRSALISAAVTGKIDIRNYSPRETPSHEEVYEPA